eukprot:4521345-Pleurochrysis_carterae.AAC.2
MPGASDFLKSLGGPSDNAQDASDDESRPPLKAEALVPPPAKLESSASKGSASSFLASLGSESPAPAPAALAAPVATMVTATARPASAGATPVPAQSVRVHPPAKTGTAGFLASLATPAAAPAASPAALPAKATPSRVQFEVANAPQKSLLSALKAPAALPECSRPLTKQPSTASSFLSSLGAAAADDDKDDALQSEKSVPKRALPAETPPTQAQKQPSSAVGFLSSLNDESTPGSDADAKAPSKPTTLAKEPTAASFLGSLAPAGKKDEEAPAPASLQKERIAAGFLGSLASAEMKEESAPA